MLPLHSRRRREALAGGKAPAAAPEKPQLRAAIYVRVSTEEQAEKGYSIPAQLEKLEGFAKLNDWTLLPPYLDDGYSAKDLNRPAVQRLLADAKKKKFDIVLVYKLDRLSRRLTDLTGLGQLFKQLAVSLKSLTESFDTSSPAGELTFNMLGSVAQFEREQIGERTRLGLNRRKKEGKWNGLPPYGYRMNPEGRLEVVPEEAPHIKRAFQLLLEQSLGSRMISRKLREEDHVSRRRNGGWYYTSVWNLLTNPLYAGLILTEGKLGPSPFPAIVTSQEFHRAQEVLNSNSLVPAWSLHSPNVLTGLVQCGNCGRVMTTGKGKRKYYYYACSARVRGEGCQADYIPAKPLEDAVLRVIREVAAHPELIQQYLDQHRAQNQGAASGLNAERISLQKQIEAASRGKTERVRWLVENLPDKTIAAEVSREIQAQVDSIGRLSARLTEIDGQIQEVQAEDARSELIADFLFSFLGRFEGLETGRKRVLMQSLVKLVVVNGRDDAKVQFTVPLTPAAIEKMGAGSDPAPVDKPHVNVPTELLAGGGVSYPLSTKWLRR